MLARSADRSPGIGRGVSVGRHEGAGVDEAVVPSECLRDDGVGSDVVLIAETDGVIADAVGGRDLAEEAEGACGGGAPEWVHRGVEERRPYEWLPVCGEQVGSCEDLGGDDSASVSDDDAALAGQGATADEVRGGV